MKKKTKGFSIKTIILIPVFVLGIVSILSNTQAIKNIRKVKQKNNCKFLNVYCGCFNFLFGTSLFSGHKIKR